MLGPPGMAVLRDMMRQDDVEERGWIGERYEPGKGITVGYLCILLIQ